MQTITQNPKNIYNEFNGDIGKECQKDWKLVEYEGKLYFSNPKYKTKRFNIGVIFDKKNPKIKRNMYPISSYENDPHEICFNINYKGSCAELIPNKFQELSNTRNRKRVEKYVSYREAREKTKKEYEILNPPKIHKNPHVKNL